MVSTMEPLLIYGTVAEDVLGTLQRHPKLTLDEHVLDAHQLHLRVPQPVFDVLRSLFSAISFSLDEEFLEVPLWEVFLGNWSCEVAHVGMYSCKHGRLERECTSGGGVSLSSVVSPGPLYMYDWRRKEGFLGIGENPAVIDTLSLFRHTGELEEVSRISELIRILGVLRKIQFY